MTTPPPTRPPIVLASSSIYRRELLGRLTDCFAAISPDIDESVSAGESIPALTTRLAAEKARALAASHPNHIIIGSDQSAAVDGVQLQKPGTRERAFEQLCRLSGRTATFYTSVAVLNSATGQLISDIDRTEVVCRAITDAEINRYLDRENVLNCAGSFKVEGLGISLFESVANEDPTALIGLPLIKLSNILRSMGIELP